MHALCARVAAWPRDTQVNWTKLANEFGVNGGNAGQIVKEAIQHKLGQAHCLNMEGRDTPRRQMRARRLRIAYGVTAPAELSLTQVKPSIEDNIRSSLYCIGEAICDTAVCRYTLESGEVRIVEVPVYGRQVCMDEVRERFLQKHVNAGVRRIPSTGELVKRHLRLAHDHADIRCYSWMMEVVQVIYDTSIYLSDQEYEATGRKQLNVQSFVEEPQIRLIVLCKSNVTAMLATTPDRTKDLHMLSTPLTWDVNRLTDEIVFFTGDMQARWYELGVQKGGAFKCGAGCGCPSSAIAAYFEQPNRCIPSTDAFQKRATAGKYGKQSGATNLHGLPAKELRQEVASRKLKTRGATKDALQSSLLLELQGLQRVPALCTQQPQAPLPHQMQRYQVLPVEPLHDVKGVPLHTMLEMVHQLPKDQSNDLEKILKSVNTVHSCGCD